ncbi:MAG: TIGR00159 family protein [Ruminococcaceae bacterium]|nr:TIGR00159 family protein [Oscillospiraceae bacterium]
MQITDVLDILILAYVIYKGLKFIRDTKTIQLLKGIVILIVIMQVSYFANLHAVYYLLANAMQLGLIAILIVFQPELRRGLEHLGRKGMAKMINFDGDYDHETEEVIKEIVEACQSMSKSRIGALIVFERMDKLGEIIETGIDINANISSELIVNIFIPNTPLHDGAMVIRNNKIAAATCFLPLTQNQSLSKELGTRHRAGLGLSEDADAVVVIVSEETGKISIALDGELITNLSPELLEEKLILLLDAKKEEKTHKRTMFLRRERD